MRRTSNCTLLSLMLLVSLLLTLAGCGGGGSSSSGGGGSVPGEKTTTVVFKFDLADAKNVVPDNVKTFRFEAFKDDESKELSKQDYSKAAAVSVSGVPISVNRFLVTYLDSALKQVGDCYEVKGLTLQEGKPCTVDMDEATPVTDVKIALRNCYTDFPADQEPATVDVTIISDGKEATVKGLAYSDKGNYSFTATIADPVDVTSVSLANAEDGIPFEWLSYEVGQNTAKSLTLDVAENEFANGAYAQGTIMLVGNPRQLDNVRNHLDGKFQQIADIDFAGSCGVKLDISTGTDSETGKKEITCSGFNSYFHRYDSSSPKAFPFKEEHPNARFYGDAANKLYGWQCLGTEEAPFTGQYDGDKFSIANLVACRPQDPDYEQGSPKNYGKGSSIFGWTKNSWLYKIVIDDTCDFAAYSYVAPLCAATLGQDTISLCETSGRIYTMDFGSGAGLVGTVEAGSLLSVSDSISYIHSYGMHSDNNGGLVGSIGGAIGYQSDVLFVSCKFEGRFTGFYISYLGGLLAQSPSFSNVGIKDCSVVMDCELADSIVNMGGFVGAHYTVGSSEQSMNVTFDGNNSVSGDFGLQSLGKDETAWAVGGCIGLCPGTADEVKQRLKDKVTVSLDTELPEDDTNKIHKYCGDPAVSSLD